MCAVSLNVAISCRAVVVVVLTIVLCGLPEVTVIQMHVNVCNKCTVFVIFLKVEVILGVPF
jgi:hypothetical protein